MADATYPTGFYVKQGASTAVIASSGQMAVESGGKIGVESGGVVDIESGGALYLGGSAFRSSDDEFIFPNESHTSSGTLSKDFMSFISSDGQSTTATYSLPVCSSGTVKYVVVGNGSGTTGCVVLRTAATSCSFDGTNNIATFTTNGNVTLALWTQSTNRWVVLSALSSDLTSSEPITFSAGA